MGPAALYEVCGELSPSQALGDSTFSTLSSTNAGDEDDDVEGCFDEDDDDGADDVDLDLEDSALVTSPTSNSFRDATDNEVADNHCHPMDDEDEGDDIFARLYLNSEKKKRKAACLSRSLPSLSGQCILHSLASPCVSVNVNSGEGRGESAFI